MSQLRHGRFGTVSLTATYEGVEAVATRLQHSSAPRDECITDPVDIHPIR